ncbi:helix-turn-helix domain-containing protein [Streptomyces sp. NBC_00207]|uniref:helix-turn-helix domain-containing protein n=1 Tax=Streptomyces sp. NBC_00207 TaxID=2903635 RepID=UPI003250658F
MGYQRAANRSSCLHNHPYPENIGRDRRGWAYCIACRREWERNRAPRPRNYVPVEPDPAAIERAVAGDPPARLTPRERKAAVLALTKRNVAAWRIAEQIGCSKRTVHRIRSQYAAAA